MGPCHRVTLVQEALAVRYSASTLTLRHLNCRIWDMGALTPERFLCSLMLLALSADAYLSAVRNAIVSGLSTPADD